MGEGMIETVKKMMMHWWTMWEISRVTRIGVMGARGVHLLPVASMPWAHPLFCKMKMRTIHFCSRATRWTIWAWGSTSRPVRRMPRDAFSMPDN